MIITDEQGNRLANTRFDNYKHLNKFDKLTVELDFNDLAKKILGMNYGTERFLSTLYEEAKKDERIERDELTKGLEELFFNYSLYR